MNEYGITNSAFRFGIPYRTFYWGNAVGESIIFLRHEKGYLDFSATVQAMSSPMFWVALVHPIEVKC
jgi:hypothetical protein